MMLYEHVRVCTSRGLFRFSFILFLLIVCLSGDIFSLSSFESFFTGTGEATIYERVVSALLQRGHTTVLITTWSSRLS